MNQKDDILMKNNALIKARYDINLYENKLFILLLHKLQRTNETTCKCEIQRKDIQNTIQARTVNTTNSISNILEGLRKKPIYIKIKQSDGSYDWGVYGFINGYIYNDKSDTFKIEASEKVHGLLRDYLEEGYTPINLQIWLGLKSSYAQRFYDLLRLWSNSKHIITYTLDELKTLLMLENKYPKYSELKRRVIDPAIKGLNQTKYFSIDIKENKIGRKVESIDFIVDDLDKRKYFKDGDNQKSKEVIELKEKISTDKYEKKEFYVPNKKLFTAKTLENFKVDFNKIDFNEDKFKKVLQEAILIVLEKDDEEKIKIKSYKYFKKILENKINDLDKNTYTGNNKKTRFHNFNETFTKYTSNELDKIIEISQNEKYVNSNIEKKYQLTFDINSNKEEQQSTNGKKAYEICIEKNWYVSADIRQLGKIYAKDNGLPYPDFL